MRKWIHKILITVFVLFIAGVWILSLLDKKFNLDDEIGDYKYQELIEYKKNLEKQVEYLKGEKFSFSPTWNHGLQEGSPYWLVEMNLDEAMFILAEIDNATQDNKITKREYLQLIEIYEKYSKAISNRYFAKKNKELVDEKNKLLKK